MPFIGPFKTLANSIRQNRMLLVLLLLFGPLWLLSSAHPDIGQLVDWQTVCALLGLLAITRGIEESGALDHLAAFLLQRLNTERRVAICLVGGCIFLANLITNDVTLFVMVPVTLAVARQSHLPWRRLIIFEALSVNAGILTPVGNPQNLYLWQRSGISILQFMHGMLPLFVVMTLLILAVTGLAFSSSAIHLKVPASQAVDRSLLTLCCVLFPCFMVIAEYHRSVLGCLLVLAVFVGYRRTMLKRLDWGLILIFILMFADLRLAAQAHWLAAMVGLQAPMTPAHTFWLSAFLSQVISNVPAAIFVSTVSPSWQALAYGANIGGFGIWWGSLASLIALRLSQDQLIWRQFLVWSAPALLVIAVLGWTVMRFSASF